MKTPRSLPKGLKTLAENFVIQYPILEQPPHTRLTSDDLDKFGIAEGAYSASINTASDPEMNEARNNLVQRLNNAGSHASWCATNLGFEIAVISVDVKRASVWEVKPLSVAFSHRVAKLPDRNIKTITNRTIKADKMYQGRNLKTMTADEKRLNKEEQDVNLRLGQMLADGARAQKKLLERSLKRMENKDPANRLLPK